jgi:hypothetical protein
MIRKAEKADIPALVKLSIAALKIDAYETLVIDEDKVRAMVEDCVLDRSHFGWLSERDGVISGFLGAMSIDLMFHERKQLLVVGWYATIRGDGFRMMKKMIEWTAFKPLIKQICFTMDCNFDKRIGSLAVKAGFLEVQPTYMITR